MAEIILGISAFYHDSAATLIIDGDIIAATQEERFTRLKHDSSFPDNAINYVLQEGGIKYDDLTAIAFYDKPLLKFERILETYHAFVPNGVRNFISSIPIWVREKIFIKKLLRKKFKRSKGINIPILFPEHHLSHAASAFYPSPFEEAAILTLDGVGEWATSSISLGKGNQIKVIKELRFPHSVGLLYSAFTYYLGFSVNSGEYKLMGLAPYGNPQSLQTLEFKRKILSELVDIREDGSVILNMDYFDFATKSKMTNDNKFELLFGITRRTPETEIKRDHMNLALAIQEIIESIVVAMARTAQVLTQSKNLVMAGGVALNCRANSKILDAGLFDKIWIQPAAGDAGGSLGAALAAYYIWSKKERRILPDLEKMQGSYLGPQYSDKEILRYLRKYEPHYEYFKEFDEILSLVSKKIAEGNVIGWFQDRMEFGPRALGNRSILGDPRNPEMQHIINLKIKFREGFRPFAPAVLQEDFDQYFIQNEASQYMLFVFPLKEKHRKELPENYYELKLMEQLNYKRSDFPAITHVDFSSRVQTVDRLTNAKFWELLQAFKRLTGHGMLINTSFNIRDEPIVCNPEEAYLGFMQTGMDFLVIGNYFFDKKNQKPYTIKNP